MKKRGKKRFCAYCGQSLDEYCDCDIDSSIYGDNGTDKTTLYDAFMWLLFDEDFEISLLRELALAEEELKQKTKMEE